MIRDLPAADFSKIKNATTITQQIDAPHEVISASSIATGQLLARNGLAIPVVDGATSTEAFADIRPDRYLELLTTPLSEGVEISDALFMNGTPNYYHFFARSFPALFLLRTLNPRIPAKLVIFSGLPSSAKDTVLDLLPAFSGGRDVSVEYVPEGTHTLRNVLFPWRPPSSMAACAARKAIIPFVLNQAGMVDPMNELGPVKLFVRREHAPNGRNLLNQEEIEAWCVGKGFMSVNPGALTFPEQVIFFSAQRISWVLKAPP